MANFTVTYPFDNTANYVKNQTEVSNGKGRLSKTDDTGLTFNQSFTSHTGFVYDSNKAEFVAGKVQQKDQTPANSIFGGSFTSSMNLNWHKEGSVTTTPNGVPTLVDGKIVCTGAQGVYWSVNSKTLETHKIKYTPNYTTTPPQNVNIIAGWNGTNNNDRFFLTHSPSGNTLRMTMFNNVGSPVIQVVAIGPAWQPTSGTEYEFELTLDSTTGVIKVFIDGVLHGTQSPGAWTRGTAATRFYLGACPALYNYAEGSFDDYIMFDNIQHTVDYTPGYSIVDYIYVATSVELPLFTYSNVGNIQEFTAFSTTETNSPRYLMNLQYWNGSVWAASNGTYAEASSASDINSNIGSLPAANLLRIDVVFDNNSTTQMSTDDLTTTYTGQQYFTYGTLITGEIQVEDFVSFSATAINTANTTVRYAIFLDGVLKYWNGSAWVNSDASFAQTNTEAEMNTNLPSLLDSTPATTKFFVRIDTSNTQETGEIDIITSEYDFAQVIDGPQTCIVYGYYRDGSGNPIADATISFTIVRNSGQYKEAASNVIAKTVSTTTDITGYFDIDLIRASEFEGSGDYYVSFSANGVSTTKDANGNKLQISVPDQISVNIADLLTAE